ncbi:MAG: hypothetical protein KME16_18725 [Scytolyngbya sp. HA4215-MV1]|jgi:signal transduction histidine kinase|nr:hypothetical protein [Scytolyngbya sp. HA4215-MV1]
MTQINTSTRGTPQRLRALLRQVGILLVRLIRVGAIWLQGVWMSSDLAEYETWRQRFLYRRLKLALHLALLIGLIFAGLDFYASGFAIERKVVLDGGVLVSLYLCLRVHQSAFGRTHLKLLFLGFYSSITLIPGIRHLLEGMSDPNLTLWTPTFLFSALLVPVYWSLHLLAQLGMFAFYMVAKLLVSRPEMTGLVSPLNQFLSVFWVCFICNFSVYLHEQFQQNEIEARQVSHSEVQSAERSPRHSLMEPPASLGRREFPSLQMNDWLSQCDRTLHQLNTWLETYIRETAAIRLREKPVRLNHVVESAISRLEPLLLERQTLLTNALPETLPIVRADAKKVRQVIEILMIYVLTNSAQVQHLTLQADLVRMDEQHQPTNPETFPRCSLFHAEVVCLRIQAENLDIHPELVLPYSTIAKPIAASDWQSKLQWCKQVIDAHGTTLSAEHTPTGKTFRFALPMVIDSEWVQDLSIATDS